MIDLSNRMKHNYERRQRFCLTRRIPVIIRVDGKAFHTVTQDMDKPFDEHFIAAMRNAAAYVADEMQGCKLVFVQSDEASFLLTDYDTVTTDAWFDYNLCKIVSVSAALMTLYFNRGLGMHDLEVQGVFDSRAFNVPREEVANYFLWRAKDWARNSLLMYSQSFFAHNRMLNKSHADLHEMLHAIGKNWATDLADYLKNGWWYVNREWRSDILPNYANIANIVNPCIADNDDG